MNSMNSNSIIDNTTYHSTGLLIYDGEQIAKIGRLTFMRVVKELRCINGEISDLTCLNTERINELMDQTPTFTIITMIGGVGEKTIEGVKLNGFPSLEGSFKAKRFSKV